MSFILTLHLLSKFCYEPRNNFLDGYPKMIYFDTIIDGRNTNLFSYELQIIKKDFNDIVFTREGNQIQEIEAYLCQIKERQIRTGLHVFGNSIR